MVYLEQMRNLGAVWRLVPLYTYNNTLVCAFSFHGLDFRLFHNLSTVVVFMV